MRYCLNSIFCTGAELENIYEPTKATAEGAKTIAMLHELLEKYQHCSGVDCP